MLKIYVLLIFHFCFLYHSIAQTDTLEKERNEMLNKLKPYNDETERVKKNSFKIVGVLREGIVGTTCGVSPGAGTFVFKVKKSDRKELNRKKINVIIQCAASYKENYFGKCKTYELLITPDQSKYIVNVKYDKIDKLQLDRFYSIEIKPLSK